MTRRPGFPAQWSGADKPVASARGAIGRHKISGGMQVPGETVPAPSGLGLESGATRERMVRRVAESGVRDPVVLQAMGRIERHRFVESALVGQAYEDTSLPIG